MLDEDRWAAVQLDWAWLLGTHGQFVRPVPPTAENLQRNPKVQRESIWEDQDNDMMRIAGGPIGHGTILSLHGVRATDGVTLLASTVGS